MDHVHTFVMALFIVTTILTYILFFKAIKQIHNKKIVYKIMIGSIIWVIAQAIISANHIYSNHLDVLPPKLVIFGIVPNIILILFVLNSKIGEEIINQISLKSITHIHIVRLPVEICLYLLFVYKTIPQIMTFEGGNFDILAGISSIIITYFAFVYKKIGSKLLLIWNFICLGLLANIMIIALLSAPIPIQQFGLDQPNIAILYFPYSWLPTFIVPVVLLSHLMAIKKIIRGKNVNL